MLTFVAVAREGSFGRAAASLLVSQPAVSERMASLERTVGAQLFARGARGSTLTAAGERLLPYARRSVDLVDEARRAVLVVDELPPLRVGVHVTFAHRAVPIVLAAIGDERRAIIVRDAHSEDVIAMLLDGVIDVGFVLPGARPPGLQFRALAPDPVVCVCAPDHLLAGRRRLPLTGLRDHFVAINRWGDGAERFVAALWGAGLPRWRLRECSDGITAVNLARRHQHVALVTASIAAEPLADGALAPILLAKPPVWRVPLSVAFRTRDKLVDPMPALVDYVRAMEAG